MKKLLLQAIEATVNWVSESQTVTATKTGIEVVLTIGSTDAYVNKQLKTLDVPAEIKNGRTFVPLRFVSENLGLTVKWIESENKIELISCEEKSSGLRIFTVAEIKKYNGKNEIPAYIAVDKKVYYEVNHHIGGMECTRDILRV